MAKPATYVAVVAVVLVMLIEDSTAGLCGRPKYTIKSLVNKNRECQDHLDDSPKATYLTCNEALGEMVYDFMRCGDMKQSNCYDAFDSYGILILVCSVKDGQKNCTIQVIRDYISN